MQSGGISGAITDVESVEAITHAVKRYDFFRSIDYDVENVAKNTGYDYKIIRHIKDYLFNLDTIQDLNGNPMPFEPSFAIAESWNRLAFDRDNIQPHDLLLLKHEAMEMSLYFQGYSQDKAHELTQKKYNYTAATQEYYAHIKETQKRMQPSTPMDYNSLLHINVMIQQSVRRMRERNNHKENNRGGR